MFFPGAMEQRRAVPSASTGRTCGACARVQKARNAAKLTLALVCVSRLYYCFLAQVQKTCEALVNNGFVGLRTFESILRYYDLCAGQKLVTDLDAAQDAGTGHGGKRTRQTGKKRARPSDDGDQPAETGTKEAPDAPAMALSVQTLTVAKPCLEARGHTGYLTVARKAVMPLSAGVADRTRADG